MGEGIKYILKIPQKYRISKTTRAHTTSSSCRLKIYLGIFFRKLNSIMLILCLYTTTSKKMFKKFNINFSENLYEELATSTKFENVTKGRQGAILVESRDGMIPLVRSTTNYANPVQVFLPVHRAILQEIYRCCGATFNNAMIEMYTPEYRKMKYHSDLALDLEHNSHIAIFSCYSSIDAYTPRKLCISYKKEDTTEVLTMDHNSVVFFSTETNKTARHKIILDSMKHPTNWLGITFRLSKTFIKFINEIPYFAHSGERLLLATEDERRQFFRLRGEENLTTDFVYQKITYTLSVSDIIAPELNNLLDSC
jgi:hypothetical protein